MNSGPNRKLSFVGQWLIQEFRIQRSPHRLYSVALTPRGSLAVFFVDEANETGSLTIYDGFEEFRGDRDATGATQPAELVAAVAAAIFGRTN